MKDQSAARSTPLSTAAISVTEPSGEALFRALIGRKNPGQLKISDVETEQLVTHVIREFEDADAGSRQFKENVAEMVANWRGITDEKDYPFEHAANVRVPLTSVYVEQMKARLLKAIFGGELWSKLEYVEQQLEHNQLAEANQWWNWELREVVKFKNAIRDVIHDMLVTGIATPIPSYHRETRYLHSFKEWHFDDTHPLEILMRQGLEDILSEPSSWGAGLKYEVSDQPQPGVFTLTAQEKNKHYQAGKIMFSLDSDRLRLRADVWRREVTFDGARINYVSIEDLVVANTHQDIEQLPFLGIRVFYSLNEFRQGLEDGFFIDHGPEQNAAIIAGADIKQGDFIGQQITDLQDREEGTDSKDSSSNAPTHRFIEAYRWEGWWVWGTTNASDSYDQILQPATQICAWVEPKSKVLLKIERLEDLNKDGKRSAVKFGFLEEPGRFYPMGLAEWVRHSQAIIDAINNQRLDAGFLCNVPFGFYKPSAGFRDAIRIEPGVFQPSADPNAINMPRWNWQPTYSVQEEILQRKYADMQAGLSDTALGNAPTKRQSATEVVSTASALDLRTEDVLERLLESIKELLTRVLGFYQQYGPEERIFRVGGEGGVQITKRFERDRLQGKILLTMCGNLQQINEQLQVELAERMLAMLMNQILMQTGIVQPDTIYEAIDRIAKLSHYDIQLHRPQTPPQSDAPEVEEKQMFAGQKPTGPTMTENTGEHLQHHAMTAADAKLMESWSPAARQALAAHIQETMKMTDAIALMNQQRAAMAVQMAQSMNRLGVRPGQPGGQDQGENTGAGTSEEGIANAGGTPSTPAAAPGQA